MKELTETSISAWLAMLIEEHMEACDSGNAGPQPDIVFNDETETATIEQITDLWSGFALKIKTSEGKEVTFRVGIVEQL